ncbi:hypothetical protein [Alkaliphilus pronyensis]|nr:hypothetical protein [Alkaliphilus pronyensis]
MIINTLVNSDNRRIVLPVISPIFGFNKGEVCPKLNNLLIKERNHLY